MFFIECIHTSGPAVGLEKMNLFHLLLLVGSSQSKVLSMNVDLIFIRSLKEQLQRSTVIASGCMEEYEKGPEMCKIVFSQKGPICFLRMTGEKAQDFKRPTQFFSKLFLTYVNFEMRSR